MSKHLLSALIAFGLVILIVVSCVAYCFDAFDDVFAWFGISNKSPYSYVEFLYVGQGDATLVHSNDNYILIDTGCNLDDGIGIVEQLRERNVKKLECIIISHDDDDHAGGLYNILENFQVGAIVCSEYSFLDEEATVYNAVRLAEVKKVEIVNAKAGDRLFFGDAEFNFIWIDKKSDSNNDRSLVVRLNMGGYVFLFSGDISQAVEERMLAYGIDVSCDVLKVAHHGSKNSSSDKFLDAAKPKYCVVSCDDDNSYGFPSEQFLSRAHQRNIKVYVTYRDGSIVFNTTENTVLAKK